MQKFKIIVDSPTARAHDWDAYCDSGGLPPTIRSRGDADDYSETWVVTARTLREALARARRTARRLGVSVIEEES